MTDQSDEPARRGKAARHAGKTAPAPDVDAAARPSVEHHLEQTGACDWLAHLDRVRPDLDAVSMEPGADPMPMHG